MKKDSKYRRVVNLIQSRSKFLSKTTLKVEVFLSFIGTIVYTPIYTHNHNLYKINTFMIYPLTHNLKYNSSSKLLLDFDKSDECIHFTMLLYVFFVFHINHHLLRKTKSFDYQFWDFNSNF